ncbi:MAG: aminoacyl-tRNA hydrolase [Hyphomicrobiales bacterium]|nr:aminoacyl-tRNA hydrolase [Hyphomicrobiales bacterium]
MKVLVGLGNPGGKYENNRHNVGFMAIDAIARQYGAVQWRQRFHGQASEVDINRVRYLLLKPATYMNESGRAVCEATRFYKVSPADVIVFHDELDLEPGKLRAKFGGGHAGHNGLKSITAHIGNDYQRIRIGIGHPGQRELVSPYVLSDFAKADRGWLEPMLDAIAAAIPHLVAGDDPKFLNEVARTMRPAPVSRRADPVDARQPAAAEPETAPAKQDPAPKPAEAEPVMEPRPAVSAAEPAPAPVSSPPAMESEPSVQASEAVVPAIAAAGTEPATPEPVEEPRPAVSTPDAAPEPVAATPVVDAQPATQTAGSVAASSAPAAGAEAPKPAADPVPPVREKEPALAGGDDSKADVERAQGIATKLRRWLGRG